MITIIITENLLLITKLTIETYLQLISLKKKRKIFSQSTIYLQVISFHKLLFISFKQKSFQLKKNSFQL